MPSIITATELRSVLGVSSALYNDTYLDGIIDTAENTILPMLVTFKSAVQKTVLQDNVATFTTVGVHEFTEGQSVVIAGCLSPYNGTRTVLADNLGDYTFSASITNADVIEANVIPSGTATLTGASTYVGNQSVRSRVAAGGQIEGVDFTATPYRMGRSLYSRVIGILGPYVDVEGICQ
jgi:hypothetical protein